jgi:hypothetical protein
LFHFPYSLLYLYMRTLKRRFMSGLHSRFQLSGLLLFHFHLNYRFD